MWKLGFHFKCPKNKMKKEKCYINKRYLSPAVLCSCFREHCRMLYSTFLSLGINLSAATLGMQCWVLLLGWGVDNLEAVLGALAFQVRQVLQKCAIKKQSKKVTVLIAWAMKSKTPRAGDHLATFCQWDLFQLKILMNLN